MLLSICIPNYNRGKYLNNCLNSILLAKSFSSLKFEICISDNGSKDDILSVINLYKKKGLKINFKRNSKNLGFGLNFYKVVKMAKGEFIWLIGNDDFDRHLQFTHGTKHWSLNLVLKQTKRDIEKMGTGV